MKRRLDRPRALAIRLASAMVRPGGTMMVRVLMTASFLTMRFTGGRGILIRSGLGYVDAVAAPGCQEPGVVQRAFPVEVAGLVVVAGGVVTAAAVPAAVQGREEGGEVAVEPEAK